MEEKLDLILKELQNLNTRVTRIEESTVDIPAIKVATLETHTDVREIKHSVKQLEQIQVDQQRIIDLLSARSIHHEAELKRIK
jgi:hypothetical protein